MESVKFTIKEAVKAIQARDFGKGTCCISSCIKKKKIQSNDISKIMSMARSDIYPTVYSVLQHFWSSIAHMWKELSFSMMKNSWPRKETLQSKMYNIT